MINSKIFGISVQKHHTVNNHRCEVKKAMSKQDMQNVKQPRGGRDFGGGGRGGPRGGGRGMGRGGGGGMYFIGYLTGLLRFSVLGSNPGWTGPSSSCHLILVCVNYDLNVPYT